MKWKNLKVKMCCWLQKCVATPLKMVWKNWITDMNLVISDSLLTVASNEMTSLDNAVSKSCVYAFFMFRQDEENLTVRIRTDHCIGNWVQSPEKEKDSCEGFLPLVCQPSQTASHTHSSSSPWDQWTVFEGSRSLVSRKSPTAAHTSSRWPAPLQKHELWK